MNIKGVVNDEINFGLIYHIFSLPIGSFILLAWQANKRSREKKKEWTAINNQKIGPKEIKKIVTVYLWSSLLVFKYKSFVNLVLALSCMYEAISFREKCRFSSRKNTFIIIILILIHDEDF